MHILITGGTGFIGKPLCAALAADGHRLTVLTRQSAPVAGLPPAVQCVQTLATVTAVDAVINLAGEPLAAGRWTPQRKAAFRSSRLGTTAQIAAWMRSQSRPPAVVLSGSAIGYYGDGGDRWLEESQAAGQDEAARLCADWEAAALALTEFGARVCCLRIGIVLGTDGGALARMLPPFRLGLGGRLGDGQQWMSWISRTDLIALLRWLLNRPDAQGVYNATAPGAVRNVEFTAQLAAALHRPALLPMPAPLLRLLFGEMSSLLLGSQRVPPRRALDAGFQFSQPTLAGALQAMLARR